MSPANPLFQILAYVFIAWVFYKLKWSKGAKERKAQKVQFRLGEARAKAKARADKLAVIGTHEPCIMCSEPVLLDALRCPLCRANHWGSQLWNDDHVERRRLFEIERRENNIPASGPVFVQFFKEFESRQYKS